MYEYGRGVEQDVKEAVHWYRLAATQGYVRAQYTLGLMYGSDRGGVEQNIFGVEQNIAEAIRWYRLAAEQGHSEAQARLERLERSAQHEERVTPRVSTQRQSERAQYAQHTVLGSRATFPLGKVIADLRFNELRVRHVRVWNERCDRNYRDHLELEGEIRSDSVEVIRRLFPQLVRCKPRVSTYVYLSSPGGFLLDGMALGRYFRDEGVTTIISHDQVCASSCAIAFIGGLYRQMNGTAIISFHAPYQLRGSFIDCRDQGQIASLNQYLSEHLSHDDSAAIMREKMRYCSRTDGWMLNRDAARLFNIVNHP